MPSFPGSRRNPYVVSPGAFPHEHLSPFGAAQKASGAEQPLAVAWKIDVISSWFPSCCNNAPQTGWWVRRMAWRVYVQILGLESCPSKQPRRAFSLQVLSKASVRGRSLFAWKTKTTKGHVPEPVPRKLWRSLITSVNPRDWVTLAVARSPLTMLP